MVTEFDSNLFDPYFLFSKKHHKKVHQMSSSESDDESDGKVPSIDKHKVQSEFRV